MKYEEWREKRRRWLEFLDDVSTGDVIKFIRMRRTLIKAVEHILVIGTLVTRFKQDNSKCGFLIGLAAEGNGKHLDVPRFDTKVHFLKTLRRIHLKNTYGQTP